MRAALALVLMLPCLAQVLPRQTVPGRNSGRPAPKNGVIEAVQVDAVAVDPSGRPVAGLGVHDFEILHDGRAQKVEKVEFVDTREHRTLVLVVDDLGLTLAHIRQVRRAVRKFIDEQLKPEDRISILRTSGGIGALQQLTSDKTLLEEAADRLEFCPWTRAEAVEEAKEQALAVGLGTLRHAIDYLREESGRKAVVLISENLRERAATARGMALTTAFDEMAKMADVGSVVFYAIDPRGLETQTAAPPGDGKKAPVISFSSNATRATDFGLMVLARDTGGMIVDHDDAAAGLARILQDLEGCYIITYKPDAASFTVATGERKFENLTVKTTRPGLIVRARNGLLPVPAKPGEDESLYSLEDGWRSRAIGSPFAAGAIRMRVTPVFSNSADTGSFVEALAYVDTRDLTFLKGLDGVRSTMLDVVLAAYGELGSIDAQGTSTVAVKFPDAQFERAIRDGLVFSLRLQIRKPGAYLFAVAVRDDTADRVGASSQFVEVPDVEKGGFSISGIFLQGDLADPAKAGVGGITKVPDENAAVRVFRPGAKFQFGYALFNLTVDKDRRSVAEVRTDILRDGLQMYTGEVRPLTFQPAVDIKRRGAMGSITLAKEMAPGHYVMRVTVTDKQAPQGQRQQVQQFMDFEVRP